MAEEAAKEEKRKKLIEELEKLERIMADGGIVEGPSIKNIRFQINLIRENAGLKGKLKELDLLAREAEGQLKASEARSGEMYVRLAHVEEELQKFKTPPHIAAWLVEVIDQNRIIVKANGEEFIIGNNGLTKADEGRRVALNPKTYQIIEAFDRRLPSVVGKVVGRLGNDEYVVNLDGTRRVILKSEKPLEIGLEIRVDEYLSVRGELPQTKTKKFFVETSDVKYMDVGGLDVPIGRIREVLELPYKHKELYDELKLEKPAGILLHGPPGCGKTLLARAIAGENNMTFLRVKGPEILSKWVGESEATIRDLFETAKKQAPSIIFFDELESIASIRGYQDSSGVHRTVVAQLLTEMDGFEKRQDVYVLAATNRLDMIDPALQRPGRFSEIVEIPRPNKEATRTIAGIYLPPSTPVHKSVAAEYGSREAALNGLIDYFANELFSGAIRDSEGKETIMHRRDVVSGDIIRSIATKAKREVIKRVDVAYGTNLAGYGSPREFLEKIGEGIRKEDIARFVDQECREHALAESSVFEQRIRDAQKPDLVEYQ